MRQPKSCSWRRRGARCALEQATVGMNCVPAFTVSHLLGLWMWFAPQVIARHLEKGVGGSVQKVMMLAVLPGWQNEAGEARRQTYSGSCIPCQGPGLVPQCYSLPLALTLCSSSAQSEELQERIDNFDPSLFEGEPDPPEPPGVIDTLLEGVLPGTDGYMGGRGEGMQPEFVADILPPGGDEWDEDRDGMEGALPPLAGDEQWGSA